MFINFLIDSSFAKSSSSSSVIFGIECQTYKEKLDQVLSFEFFNQVELDLGSVSTRLDQTPTCLQHDYQFEVYKGPIVKTKLSKRATFPNLNDINDKGNPSIKLKINK